MSVSILRSNVFQLYFFFINLTASYVIFDTPSLCSKLTRCKHKVRMYLKMNDVERLPLKFIEESNKLLLPFPSSVKTDRRKEYIVMFSF